MENVTLSSAVRRNLLTMQGTADMMAKTQTRLATGNRVNSALDNPTNFFTASSLNSRASDLMRLQDSVSNAIQTIEAADNGIKAITKLVESAQASARQALQSPAAEITTSAAKNGTDLDVAGVNGVSSTDAGVTGDFVLTDSVQGAVTITTDGKSLDTLATEISAITDITATVTQDAATGTYRLNIVRDNANTFQIAESGGTAAAQLGIVVAGGATTESGDYIDMNIDGTGATDVSGLTGSQTLVFDVDGTSTTLNLTGTESMDDIATLISNISGLNATVTAGASSGEFAIDVDGGSSATTFSVTGTAAGTLGLTGSLDTASAITPSTTRTTLETEYNELLKQIDQLSNDSSFNGNNFLDGDNLKVIFNEDGTSELNITGVDVSSLGLALTPVTTGDFQDNTKIETTLKSLGTAINTLRSNASTFGSHLSTVETRKDFTANMINTLETGAANLTLADINKEGANMLALQTRQQLSTTALSMASQADQAVLRLF